MVKNIKQPFFKTEQGRYYILVGLIVLICGLLTALVIYLFGGEESKPDPIKTNVKISAEDKIAVDNNIREFISISGKWGSRKESINEKTVYFASQSLNNPNAVGNYWISRQDKYKQVKTNYLPDFGPLVYSESVYNMWSDHIAIDSLSSFESKDVNSNTLDDGELITINGLDLKVAISNVSYNSIQTNYKRTADDTSWDGSFNVMGKTFNEPKVQIKSIYIPEKGWKIYDISDQKFPFTLSIWREANQDYSWSQSDFQKVGTIKGQGYMNGKGK